ncbi:MAG: DNA polymerase I [Cytophagales bacterium]
MASKKLFLLDALALIYRAHFALSKSPRINSKGENTNASFGFTNTLLEVLQKEKPTHIAVVFDSHAPTFRHEQFEAYKAHREEQPEDITSNLPHIKEIIAGFGIPVLEKDGYEADDVIGTLAKMASKKDFITYMMTSDKDYGQLVEENIFIYRPAFMGKGPEVLDIEKVKEKFNIQHVDQVRDILGLMGDASDNIPGIPGIGEKTAQKFVDEYGSVENLIANADKLTGKMKENVINFAQQGIMSKELATIHVNVPIEFDEEALKYTGPVKEKLEPILDRLEFRTIKKRLFGEENSSGTSSNKSQSNNGQLSMFSETPDSGVTSTAVNTYQEESSKDNINTVVYDYRILESIDEMKALAFHLSRQKEFCFDTETDSTDSLNAELVGMSFCFEEKTAYYIHFDGNSSRTEIILSIFSPIFENPGIMKIGQNIKYDLQVLKNYGINLKGQLFDTMLAHYLIDPDTRHNMDVLAENYLNYTPISIEELIGKKGKSQGNMKDLSAEEIFIYAAEDADITYRLKNIFEPQLSQNQLNSLFEEIETPLIKVLADMEAEGITIDTNALKEISAELEKEIILSEQKIYEIAGLKFNIASPKQLGEVLFEKLKLDPKAKKTKTGQYATGEEVLSKLAYEHPIVNHILEYREFQKLKSTYVDALPQLISTKDGRVHTSFNQAVAATGRLSSTNPNLQNIPIRTDRGKEIRKAFVPRNEEYTILSADYSQIELRIMAAFSQDPAMIEAFHNGIDIHAATASKVYGVDLKDVNSEMRRKAKMVNFGIIYGITPFGLSQRLDIPKKEAADIIDAYFNQFSKVKTYMDSCINQAREQGFVTTITGRRRYLRDINSSNFTLRGFAERNAINAPIQGSAADLIKKSMIDIHQELTKRNTKTKMLLQVHDELLFDLHKDEKDELMPMIENAMKNAIKIGVPLEVGMGIGENWLVAH